MKNSVILLVIFFLIAAIQAAPLLWAQSEDFSFYVIVNEKNPVTKLTKSEISNIFLKKKVRWENGKRIVPVDHDIDSKTREVFTERIHGKTVGIIKNYWQQMIFAGRNVPPPEFGSEKEIMEYIRTHPDSIGYVSAKIVARDVRVIKIVK